MTAAPTPPGLILRISVTDRCQLRCRYCMPPEGITPCGRDEILSYEEIAALVGCLQADFGVATVRITGGEPLARAGLERLIGMLADLSVPDLALTTNGLRLAELAPALKAAGLNRVNVSLDSLSPETFRRMTRGGDLQATLAGIAAAKQNGLFPLKLNTVAIREINDTELCDIVAFAIREGCEARFIELMPIGPGAELFREGFLPSEEVREILSVHFTLEPLGASRGSSARRYTVVDRDGNRGTVGLIASCSDPFCGECARLRVTADGRLIGCLARNGGISVRDRLRAGSLASVPEAVRCVLTAKRADRTFAQPKTMASIGG